MLPVKIEIAREFSVELYEAMQRLIPQLTNTVEVVEEERIKEILYADNTHLFVVRDSEGKIIASLTMIVFAIPTAKKAYIEDVVVDRKSQGGGVGRQLMEEAISYAKEQGVSRIELTSSPSRVAANRLYQSLGFKARETNFYRLQFGN